MRYFASPDLSFMTMSYDKHTRTFSSNASDLSCSRHTTLYGTALQVHLTKVEHT